MKIQYCLQCASPLHNERAETYICSNGHYFWNNPKACVAVIILNDANEMLFSLRGREPRKGTYDLPGGFLNYTETVQDCAKREIKEETGLHVEGIRLLTSYNVEYLENISVCDIVVLGESWSGVPCPSDDAAALAWKPVEFLNDPEFSAPYAGLDQLLYPLLQPATIQ